MKAEEQLNRYKHLRKVVLPPLTIIRYPVYPDITPYTLVIKQLEELFFDKLLALNERKKRLLEICMMCRLSGHACR